LEGNNTPILFLTAKNGGEDRVEGLRLGGDDYLGKPFNLEELLLRLKKLIRINQRGGTVEELTELSFGQRSHIDFSAYRITTHQGVEQGISKRESMLLKLLATKVGEVVSREEILEVVWGYDVFPSTRTIDNYILAFRKYFELDPKKPKHFFSVRGVGYRFES
jgi:two-component system alkaline phosphatase synthesis response regulator PhoP